MNIEKSVASKGKLTKLKRQKKVRPPVNAAADAAVARRWRIVLRVIASLHS